eukprot:4731303-Pyramimonas_sp.AAC.2
MLPLMLVEQGSFHGQMAPPGSSSHMPCATPPSWTAPAGVAWALMWPLLLRPVRMSHAVDAMGVGRAFGPSTREIPSNASETPLHSEYIPPKVPYLQDFRQSRALHQ